MNETFMNFAPILAVLGAYLIGSLSFAVIVSKLMGLKDPRTFGSNNPGATNVLRTGSKFAAALTLLLDAAKAFLPLLIVKTWGPIYGLSGGTIAMVAIAAFLGHLYPLYFKFKGGRGVATAMGVLLGLNPILAFFVALTWLLVAVVFRYSSLAALMAALLSPVYYILGDGFFWSTDNSVAVAISAMALLLVYRHAENIDRLLTGKEPRLGQKSKKL